MDAAAPRADARIGFRGAVVLYVVMAGVIWNLFLTEHSMGYTPANFLLHVGVPLLALADWLLVGRGLVPVPWWQPVAWLLYPAAYLVPALLVLNQAGSVRLRAGPGLHVAGSAPRRRDRPRGDVMKRSALSDR